jgi:hypothetical protein
MATSLVRVEHVCLSTRDPIVEFYLKDICRQNKWLYSFSTLKECFSKEDDFKIMVVDLYKNPTFYSSIVKELECCEIHPNLSFLFILPRFSLVTFTPLFFFQSEYCFLGFDRIDEISQRIQIILNRKHLQIIHH